MNTSRRKWFSVVRKFASVTVMAFVISACSRTEPGLVGKWQEKGEREITEFRADGTFVIPGGESLSGKYKSAGEDYIKLTIDGPVGKLVGELKFKAMVHGDVLELTDPDGRKSELYRVK